MSFFKEKHIEIKAYKGEVLSLALSRVDEVDAKVVLNLLSNWKYDVQENIDKLKDAIFFDKTASLPEIEDLSKDNQKSIVEGKLLSLESELRTIKKQIKDIKAISSFNGSSKLKGEKGKDILEVKNLIMDAKENLAIQKLRGMISPESENFNSYCILCSEFNGLKNEKTLSILSKEDGFSVYYRILFSVLKFIDSLDESDWKDG